MCRHSQPPTERQKRSSASTTVTLPSGNRQCRKRSSPQKSRRRNKVSENSFANFKRKAGRNPGTEAGITNGNFDNKKHTAQRKKFRWRCLHSDNSSRPGKNANYPLGANQTMRTSSKAIPAENAATFPAQEPRKIYEKGGFSMRTGLTKKQKVTEVYYNAKDPTAEVYTHDTKLKKRLLEYAAKFPELC